MWCRIQIIPNSTLTIVIFRLKCALFLKRVVLYSRWRSKQEWRFIGAETVISNKHLSILGHFSHMNILQYTNSGYVDVFEAIDGAYLEFLSQGFHLDLL